MCTRFARYVVVEALDRSGKSIGKSEVVTTIPPTDKPDYETGSADPTDELYYDSDDSAGWMAEAIKILTNPIATFVTGFISCVVACAVFWAAWRYKSQSWWRLKGPAYEPVEHNDREEFVDDEGDSVEKG